MNETDFILKWTEDLKSEISTLNFQENDMRKDFFGLLHDVSFCYYLGYISYNISKFINQGQVEIKEKVSNYQVHIDRLAEISNHPLLSAGHFNSLNRNLIIDSWSAFELCITTFSSALCEPLELEKLLSHQYSEIIRILRHTNISENELKKLKKHLIKEHMTHVPINRKIDLLFIKAENYYRDKKKDKEFLLFYGKLRNTMHTNFIYYGNYYEYKFGNAHFKFENGKLVKWIDPFRPKIGSLPPYVESPKLYFYLLGELKEIWKTLITSTKFEDVIYYPDPEQN